MPPFMYSDRMEARLIIFLAFTSLALVGNAVALWIAYRAFSNATTTVTSTMREFAANEETRRWIKSVERVSEQAVSVTNLAKKQIVEFEPVLAQAQSTFGFRLAQLDVRFERVCDAVSMQAEKAQTAIVEPAEKIGAAASNLSGVLQLSRLLGAPENDSDASSTRRE
jgi:hypothetical protein